MKFRDHEKPEFEFSPPPGYDWMLEKGLIGFGKSPLYPWYFLDRDGCFAVGEKWTQNSELGENLVAFARRYDNDDIACFLPEKDAVKVVLIHGWTNAGYDVVATYDGFWDWVKSLIDDIAEVAGE